MPDYRLYLVDAAGRPLRVIDAACDDDDEARRVALEYLTRYGAATADLWHRLRHLETVRTPSDRRETEIE